MMLRVTESVNWIYGRVLNPWNYERTAGGSSGGEAALVSSLCAPIGYGNDIGGSIRCPCSYTGTYGLRPTSSRFTLRCNRLTTKSGNWLGNKVIIGVNGPMAKSVDDLVALMKVTLDKDCFEVDSLVNWLPWNERMFSQTKKLRIGMIETCREFPSCETSRRAVREVGDIARRLGHEVVDMNHFDISECIYIYARILTANNFVKSLETCLKGEKPIDEYKLMIMGEKVPAFLIKLVSWWANKDTERLNRFFAALTNRTVKGFVNASKMVNKYREKIQKLMLDNRLDAWILPTNALPALKHGHTREIIMTAIYTMLFNLLDYPAGNLPVTFVREDEQFYPPSFEDSMTRYARISMEKSAGLPVGVQIAAPHNRDELVLNLMKQIEPHLPKMEYPLHLRFP